MTHITKGSETLIDLIEEFEGCKLHAYKCPAGIWTIGYGNTYYENNVRVKEGDVITMERAVELLKNILVRYEKDVDNMTVDTLTQNQFDALVDFCYNCGAQNLKNSTLLKKVNANPNDPTIENEFAKWNKGGGVVLQGLVKRRLAEWLVYSKK